LGSSAGEQLWEQLWTAFWPSFEAASGNNIGVLGNFFGTRLLVAILKSTLGNNCGEQLCGFVATLTDNCFEK
jgi:hypothetical protein